MSKFLLGFLQDPAAALEGPRQHACKITLVEIGALVLLNHEALRTFADALDRRLQKVDFGPHQSGLRVPSKPKG